MSQNEKTPDGPEYCYTKDPRKLTAFLKTMLWISLGVSVLSLFSELMQMNLLVSGPFTATEAEANDNRQQVAGLLFLLTFIVTGIAFLKWTHRANLNCRGFGALGMEFTPGWSIGYYFIPLMNLYRPYLAMKEIGKVSSNPIDWENESGGHVLGWWWALWVLSGVIGQASFRLSMRADTVESLQVSTAVSILSWIVDIGLNSIALSLVSTIFTRQEQLVRSTA